MEPLDFDDLVLDERDRGTFRVNRRVFTDAQILEIEKREIFDRVWLYAGHDSEISDVGSFITRKVGGRPLILVRSGGGNVTALLNSCSHRGNIVCREKAGKTKLFSCFYHSWSFGTDGALKGLPGRASYAPGFDSGRMGLKPVPRLEIYRGLIFISYNPDVSDLITYLGNARDRLDCALDFGGSEVEILEGQQSYSMKANWKLLVENSMDAYHAMSTHQRYFRTYLSNLGIPPVDLAAQASNPDAESRGLAFQNGHAAIEATAIDTPVKFWARQELADIRSKLDASLGKERAHWVSDYNRNLFIFPNLILISFWHTIRTFYPVAPDYMEIDAWALFPKGETDDLREKRLVNFLGFLGPAGFATPDDVAGLEGCQRGFATTIGRGYSDISRGMKEVEPKSVDELQMRSFWRQWMHRVRGQDGSADTSDAHAATQLAAV